MFVFFAIACVPVFETIPITFAQQEFEIGVQPHVVNVGQGGSWYGLYAEAGAVGSGGIHVHDHIPKTFAAGQLKEQGGELVSPRKRTRRPFPFMTDSTMENIL